MPYIARERAENHVGGLPNLLFSHKPKEAKSGWYSSQGKSYAMSDEDFLLFFPRLLADGELRMVKKFSMQQF